MRLFSLSILILTFSNIYSQTLQFEEVQSSKAPFEGVSYGSTTFADIDGDNDQDVLITGKNSSDQAITKLYLNNGNGSFNLVSETPFENVWQGSIAFADVDGDSDKDVFITGINNSHIYISALYKNSGNGIFTLSSNNAFTGVFRSSVAFADIDNDTDQDLVVTGQGEFNPTNTFLYLNDGFGNYTEVTGTNLDQISSGAVGFVDIDGDSDKDLFLLGINSSFQKISKLYINNGNGLFSVVNNTPFEGIIKGSVNFGDIDNDSDNDILITGINSNFESITKLYRNNGSLIFSEITQNSFIGLGYSDAKFADFDKDTDLDIIISGDPNSTKLYSNNGTGIFSQALGLPFINVSTSSLAIADIDGDNDKDVLVTGWDYSQFYSKLYRNTSITSCQPTAKTININACGSYQAPNGNIFSTSGQYIVTILNSSGCDSVITLNLNILICSMVTPNGITVAGGNGAGEASNQLSYPNGICVDNSGNLFVADWGNHRIQKWSQNAITGTTVAGGNGIGSAQNQLSNPTDIFVDSNGSLFISDTYNWLTADFNGRVQKWNQGAIQGITVMGGNGYGSSYNQLARPTSLYGDNSGNIFVADSDNSRVQKLQAGTIVVTTVAGGNGYGSSNNKLYWNHGVFVDNSGNIYVADTWNDRIQKWAPGATFGITVAGGNGRGSASNQLKYPNNLFVDSYNNLFIVDTGNDRIQKWTPGATEGITIIGGNGYGSNANQLAEPYDIYLFENTIYVSDYGNHRVQKFPYFEMTPCITPSGMQWKNKTSTSFQPFWNGVSGYNYVIRYRAIGSNTWNMTSQIPCVTSGILQTTISNLLNETNYEWQVKAVCSVGFESQYSTSTFTTTSCQPPNFLPIPIENISNNSCVLNWDSFGISVIFFVRWRKMGTSTWFTTNNIYGTTYTITGLLPNSNYEAQINTYCEIDGVISLYSPSTTFTTTANCNAATANLSGAATIFAGQSANLSVSLTSTSPWSIIIDGVTYNPTVSPYIISVSPAVTKTYNITSVSNSCGSGTVSGSAVITVSSSNPCPLEIIHNNTVTAKEYITSGSIQSTVNLPTGIKYNAKTNIVLSAGFQVGENEVFEAIIGGCVPTPVIPTNGLVAYYPFNGNSYDASGNNNNGTVYGATLGIDRFGVANKAYRFNDGNSIIIPNSASLNLTNAFTFSVWVNMQSTTGRDGNGAISTNSQQCIFTKSCDYGQIRSAINPQPNGTFILQTYANDGDQAIIPFQLNEWKLISLVYDGSTLKQFVEGNLVSTKTITLNLALTNNYDLVIGNMGCWVYYFNGFLDDFRMYNRALSNAEILDIYNSEKP